MKRKFFDIQHKSLAELGATTHQEMWEKVKAKGYDGLCVSCQTVLTKDADNKFHAVFSTASEDRHGDVVEQGWDLKHFKKNPVYLDSHNYDSIENIIGRVNTIRVKDGSLQGDIEFALDNPKGLLAYKLAEGGFLNTSSVGFIPKAFSDKGNIIDSELLEISAVSVPANAEALFEKDYEPNDSHDDEDAQPNGEPVAGDGDSGETDGGGSESAGDGDGGISESAGNDADTGTEQPTDPEPAPVVPPEQIVANAINSIAAQVETARQRRLSTLNNVLRAVQTLGKLSKVETRHPADRAAEKRVINSVIRQLIKQKS
jgi:HK97 family phage prohead protease